MLILPLCGEESEYKSDVHVEVAQADQDQKLTIKSDCFYTGNKIYFKNNCNKPIRMALRIKQSCGIGAGEWNTYGWYNFDPKEGYTYLMHGNIPLRTKNTVIYYYAESTDGTKTWSGDIYRDVHGETVPMKKYTLSKRSDGNYQFAIKCT
jgi:hypothetical protein